MKKMILPIRWFLNQNVNESAPNYVYENFDNINGSLKTCSLLGWKELFILIIVVMTSPF